MIDDFALRHCESIELNSMNAELSQAVNDAAGRPEVLTALQCVYADLQKAIDARRPVCVASGRCCRFEQFGHRLYVTTIELAGFVHDLRSLSVEQRVAGSEPDGCPFQSGRLCSVHTIRPFGCRIFFCDATAGEWQSEQYQLFHARLKGLHDELGVRYFYLEWREALRAIAEHVGL